MNELKQCFACDVHIYFKTREMTQLYVFGIIPYTRACVRLVGIF